MNQIPRLVLAAVLIGAAVLFALPLVAQETPGAGQAASIGDDAMPGLTLAEVEAGLATIEADTGIADAVKNQLRAQYQQAIEALKEAADSESMGSDSIVSNETLMFRGKKSLIQYRQNLCKISI